MSMEFAGRVKGHYYGLSKTEKKSQIICWNMRQLPDTIPFRSWLGILTFPCLRFPDSQKKSDTAIIRKCVCS